MSDTPQGEGWWQASDGKWYPPAQPPAPGWWRASDGNWYPPAEAAPSPTPPPQGDPTSAPQAPPPQEPGPTPPVTQPAPTAPAPAAAAPTAAVPGGGSGRKVALIIVGVVVVLAVIAGGALFLTRRGADTTATATGGASGGSGAGSANDAPLPAAPDTGPDPSLTLSSDAVVVDGKGGATVRRVGADGASLVIDAGAEGADKLKAGSIMVLSGVTVMKVASVDRSGGDLTVHGEPATLPEVITDGSLDWKDMPVDPSQAKVLVYDPDADTSAGSGSGSGSADSEGSDSTDSTIDTDSVGDDINDVFGNFASPGAARSVGVLQAGGKTVSGKLKDFSFDLTYSPNGSGHELDLKLTSNAKTGVQGTIDIDVKLRSIAHSGNAKLQGGQLQNFDFSVADLGGDVTVQTQLTGLENVASIKTPPFLKVPFGVEFPALIGGIPFTFSMRGSIQVSLSMAMANSTLSGEAKITFGGDAGMKLESGKLVLNGNRIQSAEDLLKTVQGGGGGPVGVVVTAELPKWGFGFGFLQTGAEVYISNGMVVSQTILPMPAACTATNVAHVLAGGVEAKFLGKKFDIARKPFARQEWNYQVPTDGRCNRDR